MAVENHILFGFVPSVPELPFLQYLQLNRTLTETSRRDARLIRLSPSFYHLLARLRCRVSQAVMMTENNTDGQTIGIVHMLGRLLEQAGFIGREQRPFLLDASVGSPLYASSWREFEVTYALLQPYLVGSGVVDAATYDRCYHWMLAETRQVDFRCLAFGLSAWGRKPEEPADEGMKEIP